MSERDRTNQGVRKAFGQRRIGGQLAARGQAQGAETFSPQSGPIPSASSGGVGPDVYRFDLRTELARALARALDDAGDEQVEHANAYALAYDVPVLGPIGFAPYMPHGEPDCACTG